MSTIEVLENALELLGPNGENWFQVRDGETRGDGRLCAYLALGAADPGNLCRNADGFLRYAVGQSSIIGWNDRAKDFAEVQAGFRKAIELSKGAKLAGTDV